MMISVYKMIFSLSRKKQVEGFNLNIAFNSNSKEEEAELQKLNLKVFTFNEYKYYFGFLDLLAVNLIINADDTHFINSGFDSKSTQLTVFNLCDKSLQMSLKLSTKHDVSIFMSLRKKNFPKAVVKNVFRFLANREYTIVNMSKIYYLK